MEGKTKMNEQEKQLRDADGRDAFRRTCSVSETNDRQALEDFNRSQMGATMDRVAAEDSRDPSQETSAGHADRIARAKEGL
jgi:hypothetical protein